jgi:hypothetical protein
VGSGELLKITTEERETIRRYLLGAEPGAELTELDERILSDDNFYEELLIVEDELIDQYLVGALSQPERNGFVSHFLCTDERRKKLRFSKTLRKYLHAEVGDAVLDESGLVSSDGEPAQRKWFFSLFQIPGHPALRSSLAAISVIVVLGFSWIVLTRLLSPEPGSDQPHSVFIATLSSGLTRDGGETTRISIPPDKDMVRLQLPLELPSSGYQSYTAELKTTENITLLSRDKLQSEVKDAHKVVSFDVPAQVLKGGDYQVRLSGVGDSGAAEPVGRYPFRVVK